MPKGQNFERKLCKKFSLWWTQDLDKPRDDIFWRTAGSGARATVRAKGGVSTKNSYGDMMAIDPIGEPLLKVVTIEFKCGYTKHIDLTGLVDTDNKKDPMLIKFIKQAREDAKKANTSHGFLLICKRDRKKEIVIFTKYLYEKIIHYNDTPKHRYGNIIDIAFDVLDAGLVICMNLDKFLEWVNPYTIIDIAENKSRSQFFEPILYPDDIKTTIEKEFGEEIEKKEKRKRRKL